jgi:hypothetical protein
MTDTYTEKELKEIVDKVREEEQWRMGGDTYYRAANAYIKQLVNQGVYDPYISQVGEALYAVFKEANVITAPLQPALVEEDREVKE